jgi:hypothetical protein
MTNERHRRNWKSPSRILSRVLLSTLLLSLGLATQRPLLADPQKDPADGAAHDQPAKSSKPDADAKAQAALDRILPEVNFQGVALSDVMDFLRDVSGVNIAVNWKRLEAAGVKGTATVTARLQNVTFSKILKVVLDDVSDPKTHLGYKVEEGVITITAIDDQQGNLVLRVYDVHDLIAGKDPARAEPLIKMITATIARPTWAENGGDGGTIKELNGKLIVVQSPDNQEAVAKLLDHARQLVKSGKTP